MDERAAVVLMVGGLGRTPLAALVGEAQQAIALDTIEKCLGRNWCEQVIVATDSPEFGARLRGLPVEVEVDTGAFHFGAALRDIIHRRRLKRAFYIGGGSASLLDADGLAEFARAVLGAEPALAANNYYSSDFVAFNPATAIDRIELPANDNALAMLLHRQAGLANRSPERSVGNQFDVDTPTDLLILAEHPRAGRHARDYLTARALDTRRVREVGRLFTRPRANVTLAGRVGTWAMSLLQQEIACKTRIFAEERGMRAEGRDQAGVARTLTGYYLEAVGPARFFAAIAELGDALLLDTRPLFAHLGLDLSPHDRFSSDLLDAEAIVNPTARALTEAARQAAIPVVLGGHSVVSGGMWAMIELAWLEHDQLVGQPPA